MGIFNRIFEYFKKEIELNKKYYESLKEEPEEPQQGKKQEVQPPVKPLIMPDKNFDHHIHVRTDTYTIYYAYGHVQKVFPPLLGSYYENRDIINAATFIVSDGVAYDLTDKKSIRSIQIPQYHIYAPNKVGEELGVTGCLDYVLRMRAGQFWNEANFGLAIACLEKATQLMKYSSVGWSIKDFFRIVNWLNDLGKFKSADKWKTWIETNIPGALTATSLSLDERMSEATKESFKNRIKSCKELGTDLVEIGDTRACCEKCAMYRKRVYSLTGENKLFPRFPNDYHWGCGLSGWAYIYGISEPSFECDDIVKYSRRPYVDDRTEDEKKNYEERMTKLNKEPPVIREPSLNRIIYYRLIQLIPNDMPKSLSGFSRMRNSNSKNYQALVKKAESAGFVFPQTLDDVAKWPENQ